MSIKNYELQEVSKICNNVIPNSKIIACTEALIRVDINQNINRHITVCLRFPDNYPDHHILVELKSRALAPKFLDGLANLAEKKAQECLGKPQVISTLKYISEYMEQNQMCVVYDEILSLKDLLKGTTSELKIKQKHGLIILIARGGKYYFKVKVEIPEDYPDSCIEWKESESNLPSVLIRYLNGQSKEIARQCVEPPLRNDKKLQSFYPSPSLLKTLKFVIEAIGDFSEELCPICKRNVLPIEPEDAVLNESTPLCVERVYCGHLFHQGCLRNFMQEPPFPAGGKLCPATKQHPRSDLTTYSESTSKQNPKGKNNNRNGENVCGLRLAHDKWVINVNVAEARWAQRQARERELEEVVDFLQ